VVNSSLALLTGKMAYICWVGGHVNLGLSLKHRLSKASLTGMIQIVGGRVELGDFESTDSVRYYADVTLQRMTPFGNIAYAW
jgi:hypothetical protein